MRQLLLFDALLLGRLALLVVLPAFQRKTFGFGEPRAFHALLFLLFAFLRQALGFGKPLAFTLQSFLFLLAPGFEVQFLFLAPRLFIGLPALGGKALFRGDTRLLAFGGQALLFRQPTLLFDEAKPLALHA
ncbi:MAG: hypothetical protein K8R10_13895, partial [Rhodocyclales bacterium]|nr:hypothetical protein [Rhodocyclales bacterium]